MMSRASDGTYRDNFLRVKRLMEGGLDLVDVPAVFVLDNMWGL